MVPDLICLGKGLASGMPISACLGRPEVMEAWPLSSGEALHTQTFLGHPGGCAAALASMEIIEREGLVENAASLGRRALERLEAALAGRDGIVAVRGLGLMLGIEFPDGERCSAVVEALLQKGVIVLPSGPGGCVLSMTPPLSIDPAALDHALDAVVEACTAAEPHRRERGAPTP